MHTSHPTDGIELPRKVLTRPHARADRNLAHLTGFISQSTSLMQGCLPERVFVVFNAHGREVKFKLTQAVDDMLFLIRNLEPNLSSELNTS